MFTVRIITVTLEHNTCPWEKNLNAHYASFALFAVFTLTYIASNKNNNYNKETKYEKKTCGSITTQGDGC